MPMLNSCSGDDSSIVNEPELTNEGFILKRVDMLSPNPSTGTGATHFYNGNKLDRIGQDPSNCTKYTYTGDLITKTDWIQDNVVKSTDYYFYDSTQRLSEYKVLSYTDNIGGRFVYNYNDSDGTCVVTHFSGDLQSQNIPDLNFSRKLFFQNGVVVKKQRSMVINGNLETLTTDLAFDNKHNPNNAILGMSKLILYENDNYASPNNLISYTFSATNTTNIDIDLIQYTYNFYDFPITQKYLDPYDTGNSDVEFKYFYQQP